MSGLKCYFLTHMQVSQEAGKVVWYSHLFKNFPKFVVNHTVKAFHIVSETELDVFLQFPCFYYDPMDVGNLISGSSGFSKSSLNIWEFLVHILLKTTLKDFEHNLSSMWYECNCMDLSTMWNECNHRVVWTFFGIAFLWDWNENWPFSGYNGEKKKPIQTFLKLTI